MPLLLTCVEYVVDVLKEAFLLHLGVTEQEHCCLSCTTSLQNNVAAM